MKTIARARWGVATLVCLDVVASVSVVVAVPRPNLATGDVGVARLIVSPGLGHQQDTVMRPVEVADDTPATQRRRVIVEPVPHHEFFEEVTVASLVIVVLPVWVVLCTNTVVCSLTRRADGFVAVMTSCLAGRFRRSYAWWLYASSRKILLSTSLRRQLLPRPTPNRFSELVSTLTRGPCAPCHRPLRWSCTFGPTAMIINGGLCTSTALGGSIRRILR